MLATDKQINYLQSLADKVERKRKEYPEAFNKVAPPYIDWHTERRKGVTVADAAVRIDAYKTIIRGMNMSCLLLGYPQS